ncbi:Ribosomal RNA-processing protein 1 [Madurella mycetomatis]|uniref:Ribosomal RNA-processing protein 1 n=1 Tax=Madurella mycetomatis TaxID=100816 RepID=A0A175WGM3_9PEZI|nr:Ribosomal RNA-processing protein 1 [Madurella mycetomatis]
MASQERGMPFIKNLASSDRKIRTSALSSLHTFLSARQVASSLAPLDVLKLWKGLFYALWMCDRPLPQQALCAELADLIYVLPSGGNGAPAEAVVTTWLRGFWATMAREWTGIDVLRMEKFLLLVRRVVGAGFKWMRREDGRQGEGDGEGRWDGVRVDAVLGQLGEWPFALDDEARIGLRMQQQQQGAEQDALIPQTIPVGLRLHVLDVWVDEAEKVGLLEDGDEEAARIVQRISDLVDALEQATTRPAVRIRSKDSLSDERLPGNKKPPSEAREDQNTDDGPGDDGSWDGFDD